MYMYVYQPSIYIYIYVYICMERTLASLPTVLTEAHKLLPLLALTMPTFATQISCFFLVAVVLSASHQSEARKSNFFSKFVHLSQKENNNKYVTIPNRIVSLLSPTPAPSPTSNEISSPPLSSPSPSPSPSPEADCGDLCNHEIMTYSVDDDFEKEENEEKEEEKFSNGNEDKMGTENPNRYYSNYGRSTSFNNGGDSAFWTSNYEGYYGNEPRGMSDTRYLENGKYYYNVENENYKTPRNSNEEYYYTNSPNSRFEFDSMEEYERQQEGYPDFQQDHFFP